MYNNLVGTRTMKNLLTAIAEESAAYTKYKLFAESSDYDLIEKLFKEIADNELEHAEVFMKIVGSIGNDLDNLEKAIQAEKFESTISYVEMAKVAETEGFLEIAEKFKLIAAVEGHHKDRFEKYYNLLKSETLYKRDKKVKWECMECGFRIEGVSPPEECPICGHDQDDFKEGWL